MSELSNKPHYVDNKMFTEAVSDYVRDKEKDETITLRFHRNANYIGECIIKICKGIGSRPNFNGYSYKDEMILDAQEDCIKAVHNFKADVSNNAFGYFSMIAWRAFLRRIAKEKKLYDRKHKVLSDPDSINAIIGKQFSDNVSDEVYQQNSQHMIDQLHSMMAERGILVEIKEPQKVKRTKKQKSTFISENM